MSSKKKSPITPRVVRGESVAQVFEEEGRLPDFLAIYLQSNAEVAAFVKGRKSTNNSSNRNNKNNNNSTSSNRAAKDNKINSSSNLGATPNSTKTTGDRKKTSAPYTSPGKNAVRRLDFEDERRPHTQLDGVDDDSFLEYEYGHITNSNNNTNANANADSGSGDGDEENHIDDLIDDDINEEQEENNKRKRSDDDDDDNGGGDGDDDGDNGDDGVDDGDDDVGGGDADGGGDDTGDGDVAGGDGGGAGDDDGERGSDNDDINESTIGHHHTQRAPIRVRLGKVLFSQEEVDFLRRGVRKFGKGNWAQIRESFNFHPRRTGVDLKDKWRNIEIQDKKLQNQ